MKEETSQELIEKACGFLRITTKDDEVIETEINTLINACKQDLMRNGITSSAINNKDDSLIEMAIFLYLKAEFGLDNKNYDKFRASYEQLRTELSLTDKYISEEKENVG